MRLKFYNSHISVQVGCFYDCECLTMAANKTQVLCVMPFWSNIDTAQSVIKARCMRVDGHSFDHLRGDP